MRQSQTAVLEKSATLNGDFATEPYEVAWAAEARWFVQVLSSTDPETTVEVQTQISPDGLTWCDHHDDARVLRGAGLTSWPVREFGQWLRLRATVDDADASVKVRIYLVVKS